MSDRIYWDTSKLPRINSTPKKKIHKFASTDPVSHHQYQHTDNDYFTMMIYNKDYVESKGLDDNLKEATVTDTKEINTPISLAPYMHSIIVNIPGDDTERGETLIEKEIIDYLNGNRYNIDIYRQEGLFHRLSEVRIGDKRSKFPVENFAASNRLELVSRQEFCKGNAEPIIVKLE